jgi:hypothetical protein
VTENVVEAREVTILVNEKRVTFAESLVTGAQIKAKAGVASDSILYKLETHGRVPVGDSEQIRIHEGERFLDVPGGNVS